MTKGLLVFVMAAAAHLISLDRNPDLACSAIGKPLSSFYAAGPDLISAMQGFAERHDVEQVERAMWAGAPESAIRDTKIRKMAARAKLGFELIASSARGNVEEVDRLIRRGADVNFEPPLLDNVMPPLIWASICNHPDAVSTLLRHGANVNIFGSAATESGWTEHHTALSWAELEKNDKVVRILRKHGAHDGGQTIFHSW